MSEIKLVQNPIIQHDLVEVGKSVSKRIRDLNLEKQVATEDTIKYLKELRAELNKEYAEFESQRKEIKKAVLLPYDELDEVYKVEITEKYVSGINRLKDAIQKYEDKLKEDKRQNILSYFAELCFSENIDFLKFDTVIPEINLSTTDKSYKEKCNEFVSKVKDELELIKTNQYEAEILVEYKKTLNAAKSIKEVQDRKEAEKKEADKIKFAEIDRRNTVLSNMSIFYKQLTTTYEHVSIADLYLTQDFVENSTKEDFETKIIELEQKIKAKQIKESSEIPFKEEVKQEPLQAPKVEEAEEIFTSKFEVKGTRKQLLALGEFMKQNQITFKNI